MPLLNRQPLTCRTTQGCYATKLLTPLSLKYVVMQTEPSHKPQVKGTVQEDTTALEVCGDAPDKPLIIP